MKRWIWVLGLTVAGALLGIPSEAHAQYRIQSGSFCLPITATYQDVRSNIGAIGNGGSALMRMVCPIADDGYLHKGDLSGAFVDVYDGTTAASVDARTCVSYAYVLGGSCGPAAASNLAGTGMNSLWVDISAWQINPWDYGYVLVNLPPAQSGRVSEVHGYYLYR